MSLYLTDDKSTLVQVMAWCRQATSHYLSQCWPRSLSPYSVTWPQWVNSNMTCMPFMNWKIMISVILCGTGCSSCLWSSSMCFQFIPPELLVLLSAPITQQRWNAETTQMIYYTNIYYMLIYTKAINNITTTYINKPTNKYQYLLFAKCQ